MLDSRVVAVCVFLNVHVLVWKECSSSSKFTVKTEGTEVQDRTCKCDVTLGAYNKDTPVNPDYCQLKNCEAGTELTETGKTGCM